MTRYAILSAKDGEWLRLDGPAGEEAYSADAAIRSFVVQSIGSNPDDLEFMAIPVRFWRPRRVRLESDVRVRLEDA